MGGWAGGVREVAHNPQDLRTELHQRRLTPLASRRPLHQPPAGPIYRPLENVVLSVRSLGTRYFPTLGPAYFPHPLYPRESRSFLLSLVHGRRGRGALTDSWIGLQHPVFRDGCFLYSPISRATSFGAIIGRNGTNPISVPRYSRERQRTTPDSMINFGRRNDVVYGLHCRHLMSFVAEFDLTYPFSITGARARKHESRSCVQFSAATTYFPKR